MFWNEDSIRIILWLDGKDRTKKTEFKTAYDFGFILDTTQLDSFDESVLVVTIKKTESCIFPRQISNHFGWIIVPAFDYNTDHVELLKNGVLIEHQSNYVPLLDGTLNNYLFPIESGENDKGELTLLLCIQAEYVGENFMGCNLSIRHEKNSINSLKNLVYLKDFKLSQMKDTWIRIRINGDLNFTVSSINYLSKGIIYNKQFYIEKIDNLEIRMETKNKKLICDTCPVLNRLNNDINSFSTALFTGEELQLNAENSLIIFPKKSYQKSTVVSIQENYSFIEENDYILLKSSIDCKPDGKLQEEIMAKLFLNPIFKSKDIKSNKFKYLKSDLIVANLNHFSPHDFSNISNDGMRLNVSCSIEIADPSCVKFSIHFSLKTEEVTNVHLETNEITLQKLNSEVSSTNDLRVTVKGEGFSKVSSRNSKEIFDCFKLATRSGSDGFVHISSKKPQEQAGNKEMNVSISINLITMDNLLLTEFTKYESEKKIPFDLHTRNFSNDKAYHERLGHKKLYYEFQTVKVVIFNDSEGREGSEYDVENLSNMFETLNYDVEILQDPTESDFKTAIINLQSKMAEFDCLIFFIMAHGDKDGFDLRGKRLSSFKDLMLYFDDVNCPSLFSKPKVFFFNCCRGDKPLNKSDCSTKDTDGNLLSKVINKLTGKSKSLEMSDCIKIYSTIEGKISERLPHGSLFIRCFIICMRVYSHKQSLTDIMARVYMLMNMKIATYGYNDYRQIPETATARVLGMAPLTVSNILKYKQPEQDNRGGSKKLSNRAIARMKWIVKKLKDNKQRVTAAKILKELEVDIVNGEKNTASNLLAKIWTGLGTWTSNSEKDFRVMKNMGRGGVLVWGLITSDGDLKSGE
ncbi:DgyrCDS14409 [Dimorphilus gyrociliatus]|uniref:DgyrCDS14409 n=1 Tax=Dimorphilus gyrociliatus TaxID=2664684 RepID=A0A7I8WDH7_9ANNE|nr:DgyrCDS14409 [Dimorphilus gyrociliatus]